MRLDSAGADRQAGLFFNFLDTDNTYYLQLLQSAQEIRWYKWVGGASTMIASAAATLTQNVWYSVRLQFTAETGGLKARIWATGGAEPGTWDIDATDTALAVGGALGFRARYGASFDNLYIDGFKTYYQPIPVGDWT
jgi:hypothetical protein